MLPELPTVPPDQAGRPVAAWRQAMILPTYPVGEPDRYPAYLDRRVYQGSSGRVYPLPLIERVADTARPQAWDAVHLQNDDVRLVILPQLGGRIHAAVDRGNGYDVFYRNPVIKPALVGLAGPWVSGGVEFNWPQHHRPATHLPVGVAIEAEADGAVTVWCSDHDPFTRMKGMHGVRLRPDSALVEVRVRLFNRTDDVQTFLWWANIAVRAHEEYQSFFPPDVHLVADHARRATTTFPRASTPYYGVDYPARVDAAHPDADRLDLWASIPVPTSYMCLGSTADFFGGYDHAVDAGFVHWADHRIAPGKKQWTWGNSDFGRGWERNLTDGGGPYLELMAGVFTDNQPDFSFLAPGETRSFSHYWYPIQRIGPVQHATREIAVSLHLIDSGRRARVGVAAGARRPDTLVELRLDGVPVWSTTTLLAPGRPLLAEPDLPAGSTPDRLRVTVRQGGTLLTDWTPGPAGPAGREQVRLTGPASEPPAPALTGTVEELYLIGLHLQQYRHATRSPEPYWLEGLRRDPDDVRCNLALAARRYRAGAPAEAEPLLLRALHRLTAWNDNPYDGEAHYRLGLVLAVTGRPEQARDAFGKACWNAAWRIPASWELARADARDGRWEQVLARVEEALTADAGHLQLRDLRAVALARLGRGDEARLAALDTLAVDPLDHWAADLAGRVLECGPQTLLDVALEYAAIGCPEQALRLLDAAGRAAPVDAEPAVGPLLHYHRSEALSALGDHAGAGAAREAARASDRTRCFPVRPADARMLARTVEQHDDPVAAGLLGHWLYDRDRPAEAIEHWRRAVAADPADPVCWRNLAVAAYNVLGDVEEARRCYRLALAAAPDDVRLWLERDQLAKRCGVPPAERLAVLRRRPDLVARRDDLTVELIELLIVAGRRAEALDLITGRVFHPWEGGEGRVLACWDRLHRALARAQADPDRALAWLRAALVPPDGLGEARHPLADTTALMLPLGDVLAELGDDAGARSAWRDAARGRTRSAILAHRRLGDRAGADRLTAALAAQADHLAGTPGVIDYFATSLPTLLLFTEDPQVRRDRDVLLLRAQLADLGGDAAGRADLLDRLLRQDPNDLAALELLAEVGST